MKNVVTLVCEKCGNRTKAYEGDRVYHGNCPKRGGRNRPLPEYREETKNA